MLVAGAFGQDLLSVHANAALYNVLKASDNFSCHVNRYFSKYLTEEIKT